MCTMIHLAIEHWWFSHVTTLRLFRIERKFPESQAGFYGEKKNFFYMKIMLFYLFVRFFFHCDILIESFVWFFISFQVLLSLKVRILWDQICSEYQMILMLRRTFSRHWYTFICTDYVYIYVGYQWKWTEQIHFDK